MKKAIFIFMIIIILSSCSNPDRGELYKVGMITEKPKNASAWEIKGYEGLERIKETYPDVDVLYETNIQTEEEAVDVIDQFAKKGVNLLFGHSSHFEKYIVDLASHYPDVHFVYFNGGYTSDNVSSVNINLFPIGYFAGLLAGEMTKTNEVAIIAAYEWQTEIEGFFEGVKQANPNGKVQIEFIQDVADEELIAESYENLKAKNVDVFYPANDVFSETIIHKASKDHRYSIGYMMDQSEIDSTYVLSSTILNVDTIYKMTAEKMAKGKLEGKIYSFNHDKKIITLGPYSEEVPLNVQRKIDNTLENYYSTGLLPYQK